MTQTTDQPKVLVTYEGQQHWIDASIGADDGLLRQMFSTISPELANADINRNGSVIELVARKGTKGQRYSDILERLAAMPSEVDPGILTAATLQKLETTQGLQVNQVWLRYEQLKSALAASEHWRLCYNARIVRLSCAPGESCVVIGF